MGLFRTIDYIVSNPRRSVGRKVFDVALLCSLWIAAGFSVYMSFWRHPMSSWEPVSFIVVGLAIVATARSWYQFPGSKRKRP